MMVLMERQGRQFSVGDRWVCACVCVFRDTRSVVAVAMCLFVVSVLFVVVSGTGARRTTFSVDPDTHIDSLEQAEEVNIEGTSKWSCKIAITGTMHSCILLGRRVNYIFSSVQSLEFVQFTSVLHCYIHNTVVSGTPRHDHITHLLHHLAPLYTTICIFTTHKSPNVYDTSQMSMILHIT